MIIVGKNEKVIKEYIQNQLQEDKLYDQMSMREFIDPFTGEPVKGGKKIKALKGLARKGAAAVRLQSVKHSATECPSRARTYHVF